MNKRRVSPIGAAFVALVLLVLLFVVRGALHRPARIVLPQETDSSDSSIALIRTTARSAPILNCMNASAPRPEIVVSELEDISGIALLSAVMHASRVGRCSCSSV